MPRNILLLTSTITPLVGIPSLARTDPMLRLHDYIRALAFYANLTGTCLDAIIFAENSNSDVAALRASVSGMHPQSIEFISFYGLDYPPEYGRGYGEFRLIEYAMGNSQLIRPDDIIWKVTGRYVIENICKIIRSRTEDTDLYCHMRDYPYRLCELYLLAWNMKGYEGAIKGVFPKLRNNIIANATTVEEALFRKIVDETKKQIKVVPRFRSIPIISGIRGWDNRNYSRKWGLRNIARRVTHTLMPRLWI